MNDENTTNLFSFTAKIGKNGLIELPLKELQKIYDEGYSEIKITVYGDARKAAENEGFDIELFEEIKTVQSLPDSVVFNFLKTKGILSNSDFNKRFQRL